MPRGTSKTPIPSRECQLETCGKQFTPRQSKQVYCCSKHRFAAWESKNPRVYEKEEGLNAASDKREA